MCNDEPTNSERARTYSRPIAREREESKVGIVHAMKARWTVGLWLHSFLTSVLPGGESSSSLPDPFTIGERAPETQGKGGWVDSRGGRMQ